MVDEDCKISISEFDDAVDSIVTIEREVEATTDGWNVATTAIIDNTSKDTPNKKSPLCGRLFS